MGERKVINKYYPIDFDPSKLPRLRRPKNQQIKVRMMLPMSIRCNTCRNYIYKGTKFNSRKEDAIGESYLGIQILRFYFKCTKCSVEIAIKTDPQNSDYVVESGATRNFEPWRAVDKQADKVKRKREDEEMGDAMKSLEYRTLESKRALDSVARLDELKSMKSRHATVCGDALLEALQRTENEKVRSPQEKKLEEEDEALIKATFQKLREVIRRISDEDNDDFNVSNDVLKKRKISDEHSSKPTDVLTKDAEFDGSNNGENSKSNGSMTDAASSFRSPLVSICVIKNTAVASGSKESLIAEENSKANDTSTGLQSLCQNYDSDDE